MSDGHVGAAFQCQVCGQSDARTTLSRCAACHAVYYCGPEHQKEDWKAHKINCKRFKKATEAGYYKEIVVDGRGEPVGSNKMVSIHYTGMHSTGLHFDTSRIKGEPLQFVPAHGRLIRGWLEGVPTMKVGERSTLYISPDYGYGPDGMPPVIPPSAFLVFDVECIDAKLL
eukprot:c38770_g1_i1.p2 GENE.c38770_g1_i1~~c38770_g1_i1.p2  ORF type:complete len:189 (-),score=23.39 c38770_g1_i1:77-586(-)